MYNVMIWYTCILWNDNHNQISYHTCHLTWWPFVCGQDENTSDLLSWHISSIQYGVVNYSHGAVLRYIPRTSSSYNGMSAPLGKHLPIFSHPSASGNHHLNLCVSEFVFFSFHRRVRWCRMYLPWAYYGGCPGGWCAVVLNDWITSHGTSTPSSSSTQPWTDTWVVSIRMALFAAARVSPFRYIPSCGIAGSYGNSNFFFFNFMRNL